VVLIVVDTLRADHLGCYGHARPTSPTIDALASRGVRFTRATAQSSWTAPSMVSLMLSQHLAADFVRMPSGRTLAERLSAAGWRTAAFVDNILLAPGTGFERGFDVYEMEPGPLLIRPQFETDDARPLFAYFHFVDPHDPYAPFPEFDVFPPGPVPERMRQDFTAHLREIAPELDAHALDQAVEAAALHVARERARYEGDVLQADRRVQFVLKLLEQTGRIGRTLVILTADHGECLWDHREAPSTLDDAGRADLLKAFKRTHNSVLYEELVRVPMLLAGPGLPPGLVVDAPVENTDLVPTVLEFLGMPRDKALDGRSLLPLVAATGDGSRDGGRPLRFTNTSLYTAVLDDEGWKLVEPWSADGPDRPALYDLRSDPLERSPLAVDGARARALREALQAWRRAARRPAAGEDVIDDMVRQRLEQLGYLGR
jgi:arylsulfatase A-like enzyme